MNNSALLIGAHGPQDLLSLQYLLHILMCTRRAISEFPSWKPPQKSAFPGARSCVVNQMVW